MRAFSHCGGKAELSRNCRGVRLGHGLRFKQNLLAATGDKGVIYRMDAAGNPRCTSKRKKRTYAPARGCGDEVYAGTAPSGLVLRVSPAGEPFVLYRAAREEITSIALTRNHDLYLAAAGQSEARG